MENLKRFPLTHVHAFTYSKRDGTPSATMKGEVRGNIAKERYKELTSIIKEKNYIFRNKNTQKLEILIEQKKNGKYIGLDQFFNKIEVESDRDLVGDWIYIDNYKRNEEYNVARF